MNKSTPNILLLSFLLIWLMPSSLWGDNGDVLNQTIKLTKGKGSIYQMLNQITEKTGYMFIYDSRIIDNDQNVRIKTGNYTIGEAIKLIVDDITIGIDIIGNHIILEKKEPTHVPVMLSATPIIEPDLTNATDSFFTIEGIVRDRQSEEVIPYSTLGILGTSIGTVANQNGVFRIRLPESLRDSSLFFSHLGYEGQGIKAEALSDKYNQILLEPKTITLQDIIIQRSNPIELIRNVLHGRQNNYARKPVIHTSFYREGIEHKKRFVTLTESVLKIYKAPYMAGNDQAKLMKMRQITNRNETDTLFTKFKSGIYACLMLDLIKHPPDFLDISNDNLYTYALHDVDVIDGRLTQVVSFEQKKNIKDFLYKGYLYIDLKDYALVEARFEINPDYVDKATSMFISKKSKELDFSTQKIEYIVSYKKWDGVYYINHIRGDLHFKVKKKKQWFSNTPLHVWFEMVTCKTDTENINSFTRNELLATRSIFAETKFSYDADFWEDFNIIQPEEALTEAIKKITTKIEETNF